MTASLEEGPDPLASVPVWAERQFDPVQARARAALIRFKGSQPLSTSCCCRFARHTQQTMSFYGNLRMVCAFGTCFLSASSPVIWAGIYRPGQIAFGSLNDDSIYSEDQRNNSTKLESMFLWSDFSFAFFH